jgi:hypothetical protein
MGGVVWCLQKCLIDHELLTMKTFEIYKPIDNLIAADAGKAEVKKEFLKQKYMVNYCLKRATVFCNNQIFSKLGTGLDLTDKSGGV